MSWFVVDVETDGPIPSPYSMVCFGAVIVEDPIKHTFYGRTKPISDKWDPEALAISGFTREQHLEFPDPTKTLNEFYEWVKKHNNNGSPVFVSDNPAFDFAFMNWYFHTFLGKNPFGWSARRIGDMYAGLVKDAFAKWKHLRQRKHTHNPVDDAWGNVEALIEIKKMGLKVPF